MRRWTVPAAVVISGLTLMVGLSFAQEAAKPVEKAHVFVGTDGCKLCHKLAAKGDQYGKWLASPHAKAFEVLGTEAAMKVAAAKGIKGSPQEAPECLSCHVTAFGVKAEFLGAKFRKEDGVSCESCHGAGADYKDKKTMEDHAAAMAAGMITPTAETCTGCHNEKSPTFKAFDFAKASAAIAHPNPANAKK